jgi:glycosyltransferase involved in cell wall biosynthesis
MRVIHVATLLSADGAFGGPLRVAANQADELARRGHEVTLATGWDGTASAAGLVTRAEGRWFRSRQVVPGTGFSGLASAGLWRWLRGAVAGADVVHVHLGRDLTTAVAARIALRAGARVVVQTHGMVRDDGRTKSKVFDALLLRTILARAAVTLALFDDEAPDLERLGSAVVRMIPNGLAMPPAALGAGGPPDVLFCSRPHARKRPVAFVQLAAELVGRGDADTTFSLVGPDEGELDAVQSEIRRLGLGDRVRYEGALPYGDVLDRVARSSVFVLPSVDEPFPMALLEAMALGVPCVSTDSIGIVDDLRADGSCLVTDGTPASMADAVAGLLADREAAGRLGRAGRATVAARYSIEKVVDELEAIYRPG